MRTEQDILEQALRAIPPNAGITVTRDIVGLSHAMEPGRLEGACTIRARGTKFSAFVEIKRQLQPATISHLVELKRIRDQRLLLVTPHVTPRYADMLAAAGIDFLDTAGNLLFQRDKVFVCITGRKPETPLVSRGSGRAFESNGLKLIFALLTDPQLDAKEAGASLLNQPYRKISASTGISLGSVGWIMSDLTTQGYVMDRGGGDRRLVDRKRLVERWVAGFDSKLRRKLVTARYRSAASLWWEQADVRKAGGLWGGEVGGAKLTGYLTPGTVTIYAEKLFSDFIVEHDLRPDPTGNITIMKPFWGDRIWEAPKDCVHPLLVYADLTASEIDRNLETARRVYDRYLKTTIESA
jgi:hypothetical protein